MIMMNITQICFITPVSDIRYKYFNFSVSRQWICVLNRFCPHFNIIFNNLWLINIILLLPLLKVFPTHLISLKRNIFYFKDLNNYIGSWMSINSLVKSRVRINASITMKISRLKNHQIAKIVKHGAARLSWKISAKFKKKQIKFSYNSIY